MVLSLAVVLAAQLAVAESQTATLEQAVAASKRVRVTVANGSFELLRARAEEYGLSFQKVKGYPPPHPRLMDAKRPPPPEPPTSPLPWAAIQRVERPVPHSAELSPVGAIVGLVGGAFFGLLLGFGVAYGSDNAVAGYAVWGGTAIAFTIIGARGTGQKEGWQQVYPETFPAVPDSGRR